MISLTPAPAARLISPSPALPGEALTCDSPSSGDESILAPESTGAGAAAAPSLSGEGHEVRQVVMPRAGGKRASMIALGAMIAGLMLIPFTEVLALPVHEVVRLFPSKSFYATLTQMPSATTLLSIAAAIWLLDVRRRGALVYLIAAFLTCGVATESLKQSLGRARPETSILMVEKVEERVARLIPQYAALQEPAYIPGRDRWLLFSSGRPWFQDAFSSFPSGHAISAFILAAFLCALYPQGRWLWILLAVGCAMARVRARRHFIDDVLFSAGLGWLIATWAFRWQWPGRIAQRLGLELKP